MVAWPVRYGNGFKFSAEILIYSPTCIHAMVWLYYEEATSAPVTGVRLLKGRLTRVPGVFNTFEYIVPFLCISKLGLFYPRCNMQIRLGGKCLLEGDRISCPYLLVKNWNYYGVTSPIIKTKEWGPPTSTPTRNVWELIFERFWYGKKKYGTLSFYLDLSTRYLKWK